MRPTDPRLRRLLSPAGPWLTGIVGAGLLGAVLVLAQAWVVTGLVVALVRGTPLTGWVVATTAVFAARGLASWLSDVLAAQAAHVVSSSLRRRLTEAQIAQRGAEAEALSLLTTRGVAAAEPYVTRYLPAAALATVLPLMTVIAIASQDLLSGLVVVLTLPLVPVFGILVGLATRDRAREQWGSMQALSGHFLDVMQGLPTLVAFRRARAQSRRIAKITDDYRRASLGTLRIAFASSAVLELVATLSVALVAVLMGVRLAEGGIDLHTALLVLLLAPEAYWPLRRVGAEFHAAAEGVATFEEVDRVLAAAPARVDTAHVAGPLVIDDLSFTYPGRTVPTLRHLSAEVPDRGVTALTGPSGCGKSTLLMLMRDRLDPDAVAWLPQRPGFLTGSVAENLRLARPEATEAALWDALRWVALEERVRDLPGGLSAPVGENGSTLSAGERARLALARVVLADRPWILLDEPTAHLDELTERVIADTILELGQDHSVVLVAHRPALLEVADGLIEVPPAPPVAPAPEVRIDAPTPRARVAESPEPTHLGEPRLWGSALLGAGASASGVALTATAGWLIVQASTQPPVLTLLVAIVGVRTFGLARPALRYVERVRSHDAALRLLAQRRVQVYHAVVPLTPGALGRRRGDVLTSIVDDVEAVVDRELRVRLPLRSLVLVSVLAIAVAAWFAPGAALVLAAYVVVVAFAGFLARRGARVAERRSVAARSELSALAVETGHLADEIAAWRAETWAAERVASASRATTAHQRRAAVWLASARALILISVGAATAATALAVSDRVTGPVAALLVLMPWALVEAATSAADAGALSAKTDAAMARLRTLEHSTPAVRNTTSLPAPRDTTMVLEEVTCRSLHGLDLTLSPGARVGVTGESGSGKSTLAALMMRYLDPSSGQVLLGATPLPLLALDEVRRQVGHVDDDPHVFASTIVENVRLARPDATDSEVAQALSRARLGDWVASLPEGLHTWVGQGHAAVSGGERARLALARSLLADQPILVLDEPTAHLDHGTARSIAHDVLGGDDTRTIVWITHDPVGLDLVDRVVELDPWVPQVRDQWPATGVTPASERRPGRPDRL